MRVRRLPHIGSAASWAAFGVWLVLGIAALATFGLPTLPGGGGGEPPVAALFDHTPLPSATEPALARASAVPTTARPATASDTAPPTPVPVPDRGTAPAAAPADPPPIAPPAVRPIPPQPPHAVQVERGDTLSGIAQRTGVSVEELVRRNDLPSPDAIRAGQTLVVSGFGQPLGSKGGDTPLLVADPADK